MGDGAGGGFNKQQWNASRCVGELCPSAMNSCMLHPHMHKQGMAGSSVHEHHSDVGANQVPAGVALGEALGMGIARSVWKERGWWRVVSPIY